MKFQQFLLTRFNVPIPQRPGANLDINWLAHRLHLFETYCLPSVENQTVQDFRWLLAVDARTNGDYLRTLLMKLPHNAQVVLVKEGEPFTSRIRAVVNSYVRDVDFVVSSRLDNDDALCADFMFMVRGAAKQMVSEQSLSVVSKENLIQFIDSAGHAYKIDQDSFAPREPYALHPTALSPFLSAVERPQRFGSVMTAFCGDHGKVKSLYPGARVYNHWRRLWVQVLHDRNVANCPGGLPVVSAELDHQLRKQLGWPTKN